MGVAESGLRDLGAIVPGARLAEPGAPLPPSSPPPEGGATEPEPVPPSEPVFVTDAADGADALGLDGPLGLLADLTAHKRIETPLTIGLFGPSGSGKSFALTKLLQAIEDVSRAAATSESPYVGAIVSLRLDAGDIAGTPATALAGVLHASLAKSYPALAAEAARAARDPHAAASEALERLDLSRRKLEAEKRALDDTGVRRVRLVATLLHETPGSQIDSYTRANQPRIKSLFSRLGIAGDPLLAFKEMVGSVAGADGAARRRGFVLRAFFAFRGQTKLLVAAALLFLAGAGLGVAFDQQAAWLAWLRATESSVAAANWLEAHSDWLSTLQELVFLGAALALGVNVWRGFQLLRFVFRGADLLRGDLDVRRREMNELLAFQTRRVEALAAEVGTLSRRAAEAERRAGDPHAHTAVLTEPAPFAIDTAVQQAQTFAGFVSAAIGRGGQTNAGKSDAAPRRIIVAIDHLDAVPASRGRDILGSARSLFKQGFVVMIAADSAKLAGPAGEPTPGLDTWIQVPFQIGELAARANYAALVGQILSGQAAAEPCPRDTSLSAISALDQPLSAAETRLLASLAPLAGSSARALKRFVNLYRLTRVHGHVHKGALAFMLALDAGGTQAEITAVNDVLSHAQMEGEMELDLQHCGTRLVEALNAAQSALGKISVNMARHAIATVRLFSFNERGLGGQSVATQYHS